MLHSNGTRGLRRRVRRVGVLLVLLALLALPLPALAGAQVPLTGSGAGTWGPGSHACAARSPLQIDGAGAATHVGRYRYTSQECVDFGVYPFALVGTFTITAA